MTRPLKHTDTSLRRGLRRLLALALLPALAGCVVVISPPLTWLQGDNALREETIRGEGEDKILLTSITGFISDQPTQRAFGLVQEQSTLARVAAELRKARKDEAIKAVVLRIDSPGGGVAASDEIYHRIREFARETGRPVIASLGGVAASGGYYVACGADHILAHPTTITGSIGVIIAGINLAGLLDKIGVEEETYTSGPHKDLLSPLKGATPEEREIIQGVLDNLFQRFVAVVEQNRPELEQTRMNTITDGRIFSAREARELGLVDTIGRVGDAIELARKRIDTDQARVIAYRRPGGSSETVYSALDGGHATGTDLPAQVNILPMDLSLAGANSPQFLYLWRPGLER